MMPPLKFRRLAWLICACCLLAPLSAAAEGLLTDLDGDGHGDTVVADSHSHTLQVWFSASGWTQRIHTRATPQQIIAADLDGDSKPELIWSDSNATIHVLTRKHKRFHPFARGQAIPAHSTPPPRDGADQADPDSIDLSASDAPAACVIDSAAPIDIAMPIVAIPIAKLVVDLRSHISVLSFVPRPPPSVVTL